MENLRHGSLNLRLLRVAGDSHSDCDPTGQRVSMPLPLPLLFLSSFSSLLSSSLFSSPLFTRLTSSAGGKCPALPTSDPALGLTCHGKLGLFLISTSERPHRWWGLRRKAVKPGLLAAVGALPLLSLVLTLHTALVCFSSYSIFFIMPKHFLFPIGMEDARG